MLRFVRLIGLTLPSVLAVAMLSLPAAALDDEEEEIDFQRTGFYLGANVAYGVSAFADIGNFGTAWGFNMRGGYRAMNYFALEAEYERFDHFLRRSGNTRTEYAVNSFTVNTKVPFFSGALQPYLLYGMGAQFVKNQTANSSQADFSMRMGGGIDIYFTDHILLNLAAYYNRGFGDVRDFRYTSISTGVGYRF